MIKPTFFQGFIFFAGMTCGAELQFQRILSHINIVNNEVMVADNPSEVYGCNNYPIFQKGQLYNCYDCLGMEHERKYCISKTGKLVSPESLK